jgi:hypothetical protein
MVMHKIPENYELRKILEELLERLERGGIITNMVAIIEKGKPAEK